MEDDVTRLGSDACQEAPSAGTWLPGGFRVGWGVSEVREAFVTTLSTVYGSLCDATNRSFRKGLTHELAR